MRTNHYGLLLNLKINLKLPLIFIVGPTAVGKSNFALRIAKILGGEIINADSMQVYSELRTLTARPSLKEEKLFPHHLYGYIKGSERYNVFKWCNDLSEIVNRNIKKNIYSIIVGGTGMYIDKYLNGISKIPTIPEDYKKNSSDILKKIGQKKFYEETKRIDKVSCKKVSINDSQRLKRIWEVYQYTNKPLSEWQIDKDKKIFSKNLKYKIFLFSPNREKIYLSVNERFQRMINSEVIDEVRNLLKLKLNTSLPIMRAHGVPEISNFLEGKINLEECIKNSQQVTRNYVKRQLTWWRSSKLDFTNIFEEFPENIDVKSLNFE